MKKLDPFNHNFSFLMRELNWKPRDKKTFDVWYRHILIPALSTSEGDLCYLRNPPLEQSGGGRDTIYTYVYDGRPYRVKIRDIEFTDDPDQDQSLGEIYLMSPLDNRVKRRCIFGRILREDPKVVELVDLVSAFNCTDQLKTPPKIGRVYVQMMTQFLIENHKRLGINRIEFTDNAHYRCQQNRSYGLHLEQSRQLVGEDPYYIQFGYVPKYKSSRQKLLKNQQIMLHLLTKDDNRLLSLCYDVDCDPRIVEYIKNHQDQLMIETLRYISRTDCVLFVRIYTILFERYGLKELENPIYVMNIED